MTIYKFCLFYFQRVLKKSNTTENKHKTSEISVNNVGKVHIMIILNKNNCYFLWAESQ
jgi:hypothetical protein